MLGSQGSGREPNEVESALVPLIPLARRYAPTMEPAAMMVLGTPPSGGWKAILDLNQRLRRVVDDPLGDHWLLS